jgi:Raf kinase inhibitor-like YbhB/YbcL family protein
MRKLLFIFLLTILVFACGSPETPVAVPVESATLAPTTPLEPGVAPADTSVPANFSLTSDAFGEGQLIPEKFTCKGEDVNPRLDWANLPAGTQSLALVVDDPDAPGGTWTHWVLYNIPPETTTLEAVTAGNGTAGIGLGGVNSWGRTNYGGPCPPSGTHRYFFKLYALDNLLQFSSAPKPGELLSAMEGHILAEADLMGTFSK